VSAVVTAVKTVLDSDAPYSSLAAVVGAKVDSKYASAVLTIVSSTGLLDQMIGNASLISTCDKAMLSNLCTAVLQVLAAYTA